MMQEQSAGNVLPELLAPAGGMEALKSALAAGADAVYLGLSSLNARRGAENFTPQTLPEAVRLAHEAGARVLLTLNILLTAREVGEAVRTLALARSCGVDAVLVADPALLLFRADFPELEFHFSTQAAIANSAGMLAAGELGMKRAVLARELSLSEILAASRAGVQAGVESEVFIQGALCLCVSGRCLLSSWGGGRSGNRGACTSPCRVRWEVDRCDAGTPLSMNDLCALELLPELIESGVRCLKIEGRLKNADWVRQAVALYREGLEIAQNLSSRSEAISPRLHKQAKALAAYSGRELTDGYLTGNCACMTGECGRIASESAEAPARKGGTAAASGTEGAASVASELALRIETGGPRLVCVLQAGEAEHRWEITKTAVHNPSRALNLRQTADWLQTQLWQNSRLTDFACDNPGLLVPKKTANNISDEIAAFLHKQAKARAGSKKVEIALPDELRKRTILPERDAVNDRQLGHKLNMARVGRIHALAFLAAHSPEAVVVDGLVEHFLDQQAYETAEQPVPATPSPDLFGLERLKAAVRSTRLIIALPPVFFEKALPVVQGLCEACARLELAVEVNGWDSWRIARACGCAMWGGAGMAALNPHAALYLRERGFQTVSLSSEAGERQLEDLCTHLPVAGVLTVYGRPLLAHTRAGLPDSLRTGAVLEDARKIKLRVERTPEVAQLRSLEPFNIAHQKNERITVRWLCADLLGSEDPVAEWTRLRQPSKSPFLFNFERGLY